MDFCKFKNAVAVQFAKMAKGQLYCTAVEKDDLWDTYLSSFPVGTNPMFRERTEHDCSCCRQFIRAVGNVVSIQGVKVSTIWDGVVGDPAYQAVADAMAALVRSKPIDNEFLHTETTAGTDKNYEDDVLGKVTTWDHFFVRLPDAVVMKGDKIGPRLGDTRALHDVLLRSINELSMDAVDTVLDLIAQNSLYRGSEHKFAVESFRVAKLTAAKLNAAALDVYVWSEIKKLPGSVSKIRNTSIGTLLIDLSAGMDLEEAVRKFEAVVAPENYKRTTALVTPAMVAKAKETITELGLTSALERRYARLTDITADNVIFANRDARRVLEADVFDQIPTRKPSSRKIDKVEEVPIEKFISDIVPSATSIEVMFENRHLNNLVSLIAPVDPVAAPLFKWENNFSWSYNGDMADSVRERVKKAGGNVTGDLCCRLAWSNHDDLDFHMVEPGRYEIYFGNKRTLSPNGGMLDVDMNAGIGTTREPVENIFYSARSSMREGIYELSVINFQKRETENVGFEVEIDWMGQVTRFVHEAAVRHKQRVVVARFHYSRTKGVEILESLPSTQRTKTVWGLDTQDFHKVNLMMLSPNFWDGHGVGNKHYFFMLQNCLNDGQARGFFNEFLREDLTKHRKVIEIVGSKMKAEVSANQISGLGFSSTQRNELLAKVKGNFTRTVKVIF